jgi:hypothetical protein
MLESRLQTEAKELTSNCRELTSLEDWALGWEALKTLRPKLEKSDFLARKNQLQLDGYHLLGIFAECKVVSVASYTVSPHPVFQREMIIHDMSTLAGEEGKGFASNLLQYLDTLAVQLNCGRTFVATAKAAEFYKKNDYEAHATALKKVHAVDNK